MEASDRKVGPGKTLLDVLRPDKTDIILIYLYGIFISLISLSLPLGVQGIVTRISGGIIYDSIYLLIGLVVFAIALSGALQILQVSLVEVVQRRIFARTSLQMSHTFLRYDLNKAYNRHMPEAANRFFDVLTLQKGMPKLLGDLSSAMFQIFFSLIVLTFYHPYFIFLIVLILGFLWIVLRVTIPPGMATSYEESTYKYKVAYWLEEMARTPRLLRTLPQDPSMAQTDELTSNYLNYRGQHFRILVSQYRWIIGLKILIIGGLLFMGAWLVSQRSITLGQFVASEIIVILLINSVEKVILYMDVVYDLVTGSMKLLTVTNLPMEESGPRKGVKIDSNVKELRIRPMDAKRKEVVFRGGSHTICGVHSQMECEQIVDALLGGQAEHTYRVTVDGIPLEQIEIDHWRTMIRVYSGTEDLIAGTLENNIRIHGVESNLKQLIEVCKRIGIYEAVFGNPETLKMQILPAGRNLPGRLAELFPLALAMAANPSILVWDDMVRFLPQSEKEAILKQLTSLRPEMILIVLTPDPEAVTVFEQVPGYESNSDERNHA